MELIENAEVQPVASDPPSPNLPDTPVSEKQTADPAEKVSSSPVVPSVEARDAQSEPATPGDNVEDK